MANEEVRLRNIQTVLDSAGELFLEFGVQNTTFRMIAEKSHLSIRSVHRYFKSKTEIAAEVYQLKMKECIEEGTKLLKWATQKLEGQKQVEAIFAFQYSYVREHHTQLHQLVELQGHLKENGMNIGMAIVEAESAIQFVDTLKKGIRTWLEEYKNSDTEEAEGLAGDIEKTVQLLLRGIVMTEKLDGELRLLELYLRQMWDLLKMKIEGTDRSV